MIDYVRLHYSIDIQEKAFSPLMWKTSTTDSGQRFFWHTKRGVKIRYYSTTKVLTVDGKILMLLYDTQVQNFDDIYGTKRELFIDDMNAVLKRLLPSCDINICDFSVTRIDYCFNVETPYVREYIDFLGRAFQAVDHGNRKNYTEEHALNGSVYIRTASDYRDNSNKNYTVNFYNKLDRLQYLQRTGVQVSEADMALAENILRLEVQCGYQMIQRQCKRFCIENSFGCLFDCNIALNTISNAYSLVFKGNWQADYYTYQEAKRRLKGKQAALKTILAAATNHSITAPKYAYSRNQAKEAGVYPFCFLPSNSSVSHLENPMKLLLKKADLFDMDTNSKKLHDKNSNLETEK